MPRITYGWHERTGLDPRLARFVTGLFLLGALSGIRPDPCFADDLPGAGSSADVQPAPVPVSASASASASDADTGAPSSRAQPSVDAGTSTQAAPDSPNSDDGSSNGSLPGGQSKVSESISDADDSGSPFWANYYGIIYGPSVSSPSSYQSTPDGSRDPNRPLLMKNFFTAGYNFSSHVAIAATGWWNYVPVQGGDLITQDPSARIAYNDIIHSDSFNWYGDLRSYFPVTYSSREADLLAGFQTFHYFSYTAPGSRLTLGTYASVRYNIFGKQGAGDDLELYFAPAVSYQVSPTVALTGLYEFSENHSFGADPFQMYNDGTVLEPGVEWAVTPAVFLNPYLYIYTNGVSNTGMGATVSWLML